MLNCDVGQVCTKGYHIRCLDPPLTAVPKGEWLCRACRELGYITRELVHGRDCRPKKQRELKLERQELKRKGETHPKTSKHRGVHWNEAKQQWEARINGGMYKRKKSIGAPPDSKGLLLGTFGPGAQGEIDAVRCYSRYAPACQLHGVHPEPEASAFPGVTWDRRTMDWKATWHLVGKRPYVVGHYNTESLAAAAHKSADRAVLYVKK
jgi:hypothetical protein